MVNVSQFKNYLQVLDYFKDDKTCEEYIIQRRWKNKPCCPHCKSDRVYRTNRGLRCGNRKECGKKFSVRNGTIFEHSNIKLRYWFAAMYLFSSSKRGISSWDMANKLGITQKSSWYMLHRLRKVMEQKHKQPMKGVIMADESFCGGKNKNRHFDKKVKKSQGRSFKDKTPVLGLLDETGHLRTFRVVNTSSKQIMPLVRQHVEPGATLITDEWHAYNDAQLLYDHHVVHHNLGKYKSNSGMSTNAVENVWSHFKRSITGVYYQVSRRHLPKYLDEFTFKFNTRQLTNSERFETVFDNIGQTLPYKELIRA